MKTEARQISLAPIGIVKNEILQPVDDNWGKVRSWIELDDAGFAPGCLDGLETFSHVEVIYHFHRVDPVKIETGTRHPRGRQDWPKVGIFAQRNKDRPNRLGTTVCRLLSVQPLALEVEGLDAINGTPVLDLKPFMAEFGPRGALHQPKWAIELMARYWTNMGG